MVKKSIESIATVQGATTVLHKEMDALDKQAESIGAIMTVISDIADQTNLLALNAAIEAARAGEAGRGFAVVADEVRKLAEKTMHATQEVSQAIEGVQKGTHNSMDAVAKTIGYLDETSTLVHQSGESLQLIVEEAVRVADQVQGIAAAAEQQSATSVEISKTLSNISTSANETSIAMQQSAQAVSDLAHQTSSLQHLMEGLRG